jgi:hypothetical protein
MPDQNQPDPNKNSSQPIDKPAGSAPPIIFPQSDLPPLPPVFSTINETGSAEQNTPKSDVPATPPLSQVTNPPADINIGSGAPPDISSVIPKAKKKFGGGKIIATILGLVILVGGVGAGILLTQQPQLFQQKAAGCSGTGRCTDMSCAVGCDMVQTGNGFCECRMPTPVSHCDAENTKDCIYGCTPDVNGGTCNACSVGQNEETGCTNTISGQSCPGKKTRSCQNGQWGSWSTTCFDIADSCPTSTTTTTTTDDAKCSGIVNNSTTLGVGSLYPTCYVNHYWCQTSKPGGCTDQIIGNAVQSASFSKNCGTEQIDLYCPSCPNYIASQQNKINGQLFVSKIYPNECSTSTNPPVPTPTPTPGAPSCISVKAYDDGWTALTPTQLSALAVGDIVNFCVNGTSTTGTFDKAQFMINTTLKSETTTLRPSSTDFCQNYTILSTDTTVEVKAKIHSSTGVWVGETI